VSSLKEKTAQHWFTYFQIAHKYWKYCKTYPLTIIFDDFCIWLLRNYWIEFICL